MFNRNNNKYGARRTTVDNIEFDSAAEAKRYAELKLLLQAREIEGLEVHPRFDLVVERVKVGVYEADFQYFDMRTNHSVVEDVKSNPTRTAVYRLKKKLMRALYGIEVVEI